MGTPLSERRLRRVLESSDRTYPSWAPEVVSRRDATGTRYGSGPHVEPNRTADRLRGPVLRTAESGVPASRRRGRGVGRIGEHVTRARASVPVRA